MKTLILISAIFLAGCLAKPLQHAPDQMTHQQALNTLEVTLPQQAKKWKPLKVTVTPEFFSVDMGRVELRRNYEPVYYAEVTDVQLFRKMDMYTVRLFSKDKILFDYRSHHMQHASKFYSAMKSLSTE